MKTSSHVPFVEKKHKLSQGYAEAGLNKMYLPLTEPHSRVGGACIILQY